MDRERALTVVSILLAVVVVGTVGAGLIDSSSPDGERDAGLGAGEGDGVGSGNGSGFGLESDVGDSPRLLPSWLVGGYVGILVAVSMAVALIYVPYLLITRRWRDLLQSVVDALLPFGVALALLLGAFLLSALFRDGGGGTLGGQANPVAGAGGSESVSSLGLIDVAPAVVAVVAVLFVGFVAMTSRGGDGSADSEPPLVDAQPAVPADASLAELETVEGVDAPAGNDVYRAWERLATEVGASRTTTPAEVSTAAKAAGFDTPSVEELTALFREARYGGTPPSAQSERRARELIDRLSLDSSRVDVKP